MRIALIEFDYHAEVLRNTLHILLHNGNEVHVFTSERIWQKVDWDKGSKGLSLHLQKKDSLTKFLEHKRSAINGCDLILFNTLASNFKLWSKQELKAPIVLRIHNANATFTSLLKAYRPIWKPFFMWKDLSYFIRIVLGKQEPFYKSRFLKKVDHYAFPDEGIRSFAVNEFGLNPNQCISLPFVFWESVKPIQKTSPKNLNLTIIGKVDRRNRDYEIVVNAFKRIASQLEQKGIHIKLNLLGKAVGSYASRVIDDLEKLNSANFQLNSFSDFVSQEEFENELDQTSFLIIPTRIRTRFTVYSEWYGSTKISGSINDVIRYHRLALINAEYPVPKDISQAFRPYKDANDLAEQILQQAETHEYQKLDYPTLLNGYKLESISETYQEFLQKADGRKDTDALS